MYHYILFIQILHTAQTEVIAPILSYMVTITAVIGSITGTIIAIRKERKKMAPMQLVINQHNELKESIVKLEEKNEKSIDKLKEENKEYIHEQIENIEEKNEEIQTLLENKLEAVEKNVQELKKDTKDNIETLNKNINQRFDDLIMLIKKPNEAS